MGSKTLGEISEVSDVFKTNQTYRTMGQFERQFLPKAYMKKISNKMENDPKTFGEYLAQKSLNYLRRELN